MICVCLRVNFVLKSTTLLLLCSYHVLKWELFILDSIILFLCFARSKFCSKIPTFSIRIALTLARTARLTLYGTFFTIYCIPFIFFFFSAASIFTVSRYSKPITVLPSKPCQNCAIKTIHYWGNIHHFLYIFGYLLFFPSI